MMKKIIMLWERERERETETETDRQTDRQTDRMVAPKRSCFSDNLIEGVTAQIRFLLNTASEMKTKASE